MELGLKCGWVEGLQTRNLQIIRRHRSLFDESLLSIALSAIYDWLLMMHSWERGVLQTYRPGLKARMRSCSTSRLLPLYLPSASYVECQYRFHDDYFLTRFASLHHQEVFLEAYGIYLSL